MASRREEKERLRRERLAAEQREAAEARRRLILGYVVAGLLAAAVVAGIVVVIASSGDEGVDAPENAHIDTATGSFAGLEPDAREGTEPPPVEQADLQLATKATGCKLELGLPDEGNGHLAPGQDPPNYGTNPPTSGDHDPTPTADGAYLDTPELRHYVHSLEHGRIEIHYSSDLPEKDQLLLKGVFDEDPEGMLLFPDPQIEADVAVAAWTNLMSCPTFRPEIADAIRAFRDSFRGTSGAAPESTAPL